MVSLALAWIVGVYIGDMNYNAVIGAFPVALFITLAGVTLLFGMANVNGTLQRLAARAVSAVPRQRRDHPGDVLRGGAVLSSIGPGNIATAALLAPMGMAVGAQAGVPPFLMRADARQRRPGRRALAVRADRRDRQRRDGSRSASAGQQWTTYGNNLMAHVVITFLAYLLFGGWKLFTLGRARPMAPTRPSPSRSRPSTG